MNWSLASSLVHACVGALCRVPLTPVYGVAAAGSTGVAVAGSTLDVVFSSVVVWVLGELACAAPMLREVAL